MADIPDDPFAAEYGTRCHRCGADPAPGFAAIGDDRYCHYEVQPSCYELAQQLDDNPVAFLDAWMARLRGSAETG